MECSEAHGSTSAQGEAVPLPPVWRGCQGSGLSAFGLWGACRMQQIRTPWTDIPHIRNAVEKVRHACSAAAAYCAHLLCCGGPGGPSLCFSPLLWHLPQQASCVPVIAISEFLAVAPNPHTPDMFSSAFHDDAAAEEQGFYSLVYLSHLLALFLLCSCSRTHCILLSGFLFSFVCIQPH